MNKAIFFDRDGTLIIDKHYLCDPQQVNYLPGYFELIKHAQQKNYLLFIVTNQSGIARGYFTIKQMDQIHQKMQRELKNHGLREFDDIVFCPHAPEDGCKCRKPSPELVEQLISKYNISRAHSYFIGDKEIDYQCGLQAGINKSFQLIAQPSEPYQISSLEQLHKMLV